MSEYMTEEDISYLTEVLNGVLEHETDSNPNFSEAEFDFCTDMLGRMKKYGKRMFKLSERQAVWVEKMEDRL